MVGIAFQSVFCLEIYHNNIYIYIFLILKNSKDQKTLKINNLK